MVKKKVLFIAYYYPPIKAIGSLRPYFLSKELSGFDWQVYVNTTANNKFLSRDELPTNFLKGINEVYTFDFQKIKLKLVKAKVFLLKFLPKQDKDKKNLKSNSGFKLRKLLNSFLLNISYEGGWIYILLSVIKAHKMIKSEEIKYIYSTFSPYSNHLVAYFLKLLNKDLIWIVDFRDLPPGISAEDLFGRKYQETLNKKIIAKADLVTTVSMGLKKVLVKYNKNCTVIYNGFDVMNPNEEIEMQDFVITYTGSLYGGKRNIEPILKGLQRVCQQGKNIKFVYAGKDSNIVRQLFKKYKLENILIDKGIIDRNEALKLQRKSSINLMVTWATKEEKGILTGKFFEYIQARKAILCLIHGEHDKELESIIGRCNVGEVVYQDEVDKIEKFILNLLHKRLMYQFNIEEVNQYSYKSLANKLSNYMLELDTKKSCYDEN